jgi:hypothetical protein
VCYVDSLSAYACWSRTTHRGRRDSHSLRRGRAPRGANGRDDATDPGDIRAECSIDTRVDARNEHTDGDTGSCSHSNAGRGTRSDTSRRTGDDTRLVARGDTCPLAGDDARGVSSDDSAVIAGGECTGHRHTIDASRDTRRRADCLIRARDDHGTKQSRDYNSGGCNSDDYNSRRRNH